MNTLSKAALRRADEEQRRQRSFSDVDTWIILAYEARHNPDLLWWIMEWRGEQMTIDELRHQLSLTYPDYLLEIGEQPDAAGYQLWQARNRFVQLRREGDADLIVDAVDLPNGQTRVTTADGSDHWVTSESFHRLSVDCVCRLSACVRVQSESAAA